jgi:hypothetical protein
MLLLSHDNLATLLEVPTFEIAFHFIFQVITFKFGWWSNHMLAIWPQGIFFEWLKYFPYFSKEVPPK